MRKRSRKSVKSVLELDIDGLPFEPSDDSSSGEETFLVATSREKHKAGKRMYANLRPKLCIYLDYLLQSVVINQSLIK